MLSVHASSLLCALLAADCVLYWHRATLGCLCMAACYFFLLRIWMFAHTAAGGEGGALGAQQSFLAVINSSLVGTPPAGQTQQQTAAAGGTGPGRDAYRSILMSAYSGELLLLLLLLLLRGSALLSLQQIQLLLGMAVNAAAAAAVRGSSASSESAPVSCCCCCSCCCVAVHCRG
jgi:hypothetical protein